jgi:hypothetical protein
MKHSNDGRLIQYAIIYAWPVHITLCLYNTQHKEAASKVGQHLSNMLAELCQCIALYRYIVGFEDECGLSSIPSLPPHHPGRLRAELASGSFSP